MQERRLRFVYNDYNTPYVDHLRKSHVPSASIAWRQSAVIGVYKALDGLSPKVHAMYVHTKQKQPQSTFY